ncbi:MAG: hypothetical protein APF76_04740 [Desulfitibacter sp. BRH_c19]|nr:MAG: hypothetical protein APF76_04740 [Desulfitibacter sp. BRH_c19]
MSDNNVKVKYYNSVLRRLEKIKRHCMKFPNRYHKLEGLRYSGLLNGQKKYFFKDYLTDKELKELKEKYNAEDFQIKFRWCTTNWLERKGLEISLLYIVSI